MRTKPETPDLLYGVLAISKHLGLTEAQARHLCEVKSIPTFKLPGSRIMCARRSTLDTWLADLEAKAMKEAANG